jgi:hypothetical protein
MGYLYVNSIEFMVIMILFLIMFDDFLYFFLASLRHYAAFQIFIYFHHFVLIFTMLSLLINIIFDLFLL